jgi:four helix bundle protein
MATGKASNPIVDRTTLFGLQIIDLYRALPRSQEAVVLGKQVLQSGTSVGATIREARRSRTVTEMISKTEHALQELDETSYWLELLEKSGIVPAERFTAIRQETDELMAMLVKSAKTLKARRANNP